MLLYSCQLKTSCGIIDQNELHSHTAAEKLLQGYTNDEVTDVIKENFNKTGMTKDNYNGKDEDDEGYDDAEVSGYVSESRNCTEDIISSQTHKYVKHALVIDEYHHHDDNKGDFYVNRHLSEMFDKEMSAEITASYFPDDIPALIQLNDTDDDSSSEDEDYEESNNDVEDGDNSNNESGYSEESDVNSKHTADEGNSDDYKEDKSFEYSPNDSFNEENDESNDENASIDDNDNESALISPINDTVSHTYLKCWYTNAEFIKNKMEEFRTRISKDKPDIIAIVESGVQNIPNDRHYYPDQSLQLDDYELYRKDNEDEIKGGILVYIKSQTFTIIFFLFLKVFVVRFIYNNNNN